MSSFTIVEFCVEKYHDGKYPEWLSSLLPPILVAGKHGWCVTHGALCQRLWTCTVAQGTLQSSSLEALWGNREEALPLRTAISELVLAPHLSSQKAPSK